MSKNCDNNVTLFHWGLVGLNNFNFIEKYLETYDCYCSRELCNSSHPFKKITMRFYVNMMNGSSWFFQNISEIDRCNESAFFLLDFLKFFKLLKCDNTFTGDLEITEQSYI